MNSTQRRKRDRKYQHYFIKQAHSAFRQPTKCILTVNIKEDENLIDHNSRKKVFINFSNPKLHDYNDVFRLLIGMTVKQARLYINTTAFTELQTIELLNRRINE